MGGLVIAGRSRSAVCGVRDTAAVVADELVRRGVDVHRCWSSAGPAEAWLDELEAAADAATAIVLHYSPFSHGWRGVPTAVPALARRLAGTGAPVVLVAHELAHTWRGGLRGVTWAATQRLALARLVGAADVVLVSTDERAAWLRRRRWLSRRRPVRSVPVPPPLPILPAIGSGDGTGVRVALFGYVPATTDIELVVRTAGTARRAGIDLTLDLLGAPGDGTPVADRWRRLAVDEDLLVTFSGVLPPDELAARLAAADLVVVADPDGPTARRSTLAAALAAGQAVLALDGPRTWPALAAAGAVHLEPAGGFAPALVELATDADRRAALGARARAFADRLLAPAAVADALLDAVEAAR